MNPVIVAIDEGHYQRSIKVGVMGEQTKLACRRCSEPMPCSTITSARRRHALSVRAG